MLPVLGGIQIIRSEQGEVTMKTNLPRILLGCALTLLLYVPLAIAQTVTGSITGQVTDPTGAVIAGARVVAHNLDTGVDTPTTSNSTGLYRIDFLPVGHYEVAVEASGFEKVAIPPFTLEVLQSATFNVKLNVGNASTTVSVSAAAPILNTDNPTLGTSFTANTIENLPPQRSRLFRTDFVSARFGEYRRHGRHGQH